MLQPRWACSPPPPTHNPAPRHHQTLHDTVEGLVEVGLLRPVMDREFPLAQAAQAHARMESGDHIGKIVLAVG